MRDLKIPQIAWPAPFLIASTLLVARGAQAAPASRLVYGRAPGILLCPDEMELREAVRARLGYDPFFPWAKQTIVVQVAPRPNRRLSGKVYLVDDDGHASSEREFTTSADECGELVLTLSLAIVMTLDPLHGSASSASPASAPRGNEASPPSRDDLQKERSPAAADSSPTSSTIGTRPSSNEAPRDPFPVGSLGDGTPSSHADAGTKPMENRPPDAFGLDAGGGVLTSMGEMPGFSAGFAPVVRGRSGALSLAAEGRFEFSALAGESGDRAQISLMGGAAVPCLHWGVLASCASIFVGRYRAEGLDPLPKASSALFSAASIRAGAELPIASGLRGFVRADGVVNFTRHELVIAGDSIWRVSAVGLTLSAGVLASIL